jgi:Amt family ammonium transporter
MNARRLCADFQNEDHEHEILASMVLGRSLLAAGTLALARVPATSDTAAATSHSTHRPRRRLQHRQCHNSAPAAAICLPACALRLSPTRGDTTWMMLSTLVVLMMSDSGWPCFTAAGAQQKKEHAVGPDAGHGDVSMIVVLWVIYGCSIAFAGQRLLAADRLFMRRASWERSRHVCQRTTFNRAW